jgi:beta-lactamase regulating signal transducer with metallopeptidase domain
MNVADLLSAWPALAAAWAPWLWLHVQGVSLAVVVVLLLRPWLRRAGGAQAAHLAWCAVPAAALGGLLPLPMLWPAMPLPAVLLSSTAPAMASGVVPIVSTALPSLGSCMVIWLIGVFGVAAPWWLRQRAAVASLQQHPGETHWRSAAGSSPALFGAWRPRLVLPLDFEARFDAAEQAAMLAHEAQHQRRHDNRWSLLACGLVALQWFNPLLWWALKRFHADQELACDAATLNAATPLDIHAYLRALLKSHDLDAPLAPVASSWRGTHPLVERIAMLKQHHLGPTRRRAGRWLALGLGLLTLGAGHALQAGQDTAATKADTVMLYLTVDHNGQRIAAPRLFGVMGQPMSVRMGLPQNAAAGSNRTAPWELELVTTVHDTATQQLRMQARLSMGAPLQRVASPVLVTAEGQTASFEVQGADGVLSMTVLARRGAPAPEMQRAP